jgi:electron transfer flavoprotein alpha/beta subunit
MNVKLHSTTKIVEVEINGAVVPARIWEGETDSGIPVHAYVTRIAVDKDADVSQFERELQECSAPTPAVAAIPLRMIW